MKNKDHHAFEEILQNERERPKKQKKMTLEKNRLIWGNKRELKKKKTCLELVSIETLEDIFINQEQNPMKK